MRCVLLLFADNATSQLLRRLRHSTMSCWEFTVVKVRPWKGSVRIRTYHSGGDYPTFVMFTTHEGAHWGISRSHGRPTSPVSRGIILHWLVSDQRSWCFLLACAAVSAGDAAHGGIMARFRRYAARLVNERPRSLKTRPACVEDCRVSSPIKDIISANPLRSALCWGDVL